MFTKRYNSLLLLFAAGLLLLIHSCKKDETAITSIPDIVIGESVITEKTIGDVVQLAPDVSYGGQNANFTYKWYRNITVNYVAMYKLISQDKTLKITMDSLGTMLLRLEVTNVATKVMASSSVSFNVIGRSERGWYVLKQTADGNTDMDAFLTTNTGSAINRDIINTINGKPMLGTPVGLSFTANYNWYNTVVKNFTGYNSCLMPVSGKDIMAYRVKDERILANTDHLFFEVPSVATRNFEGMVSDPNLMAMVNNGQVLTMNTNSYSFLPARTGDYTMAPYFTLAPYGNSGYILGYDQKNESFINIQTRETAIHYFPDAYLPEKGGAITNKISSNKMGGKLIFLENTDGSVDSLATFVGRAYGLLKKNNSNDLVLLGLNIREILPSPGHNGTHSPVRSQETLSAGAYPALTSATTFALHKNNPILYFGKSNMLGSYAIDTKSYSANIYTFGAGEEITYLKFIDQQYDTAPGSTFRNLVVATYLNGNYKIYRFTVLGNTLTQLGTAYEGVGRVKTMIYCSPNTGNFFNGMYRYY